MAQNVFQVGKNRPTIESPIDGLAYVGTRAVGVELDAGSAFCCADQIQTWLKG